MDILRISGLCKSFGEKKVLDKIELSVPEGSVFAFIGKNGAGKTTTMKAILGLIRADCGEILVSGEKVSFGETSTNKYIGYLPDVPEFYSFMTPREYLIYSANIMGVYGKEAGNRADELLSLVGLEGNDRRIKGFSRGMKQRLGIAGALVGRPRLLICDEPTSALDPIGRREILDLLFSIKSETTVFFSTHILSDAEGICDHAAILNDGKIVMQGEISALKDLNRGDEFTLVLKNREDAQKISSAFSLPYVNEKDIRFIGDDSLMENVLRFVLDEKIQIVSLSRTEPSLESLFMEVASK